MIDIRKLIRIVPDFPKPGIGFFDITTLLKDKQGFQEVIDTFANHFKDFDFDKISGVEARGFVFASALAYKMNKGLILIRKPGKLPAETFSQEYELEYGADAVEMHKDAVEPSEKIVVIDDLIATGGTVKAACKLIENAGGEVAGIGFMIELCFLKGIDKLKKYNIYSMLKIEDD